MQLPKDSDSVRMQIGPHKTASQDATLTGLSSFNLDGSAGAATSEAFAYNTPIKVVATDSDIWVKVGSAVTAVDSEGEFIGVGSYDHIFIDSGDKISVIGGIANIVPIND